MPDDQKPVVVPAPPATPEAARVEDLKPDAPLAREVEPLDPDQKHDQLKKKTQTAEDRQEALLDEGLEETFPSSDPVSVKRIT